MAQVLYEYYDLYNRGLVNFGGTLATGLVDVNPGAAAVRPVTMAARITPYLRYYATRRPLDDHGVVPLVLVVFDDDLAAGHFLRAAELRPEGRGVADSRGRYESGRTRRMRISSLF